MSPGQARWVLADGWGMVDRPEDGEHGGRVYLAPVRTGEIHVVTGAAAVVARSSLFSTDLPELRDRTADALQVTPEELDDEVLVEVLDDLQRLGAVVGRPV
ncbi:hypothetical protein [Ornithinimicrobium kibberense]|uniref:Coenzyme PQQ synthesis protein D (PqqD) n=1 Tax=Ornithinimicrobium kibberense TaxID=282060 RepID=A0ABV5V1P8_9MICO|nr:hypothetical protein [Ornithinimicrobium kibberense]